MVQGAGCLNVALVLSLTRRPELTDVTRGYARILERTASRLDGLGVGLRGTSDLAVGDLKVSGNAQKRTARALLHHGTILHRFDLEAIARYLREPERQPKYRRRRRHADFVTNLGLGVEEIKARIADAWGARPGGTPAPLQRLDALVASKYANRAWTERF